MTNEELQEQISRLERELNDLKSFVYKEDYANLKVFKKKVELKGDTTITKVDISNLNDLTQTGGTAVIADGNHQVNIPAGGGNITINTKNGVITAIS